MRNVRTENTLPTSAASCWLAALTLMHSPTDALPGNPSLYPLIGRKNLIQTRILKLLHYINRYTNDCCLALRGASLVHHSGWDVTRPQHLRRLRVTDGHAPQHQSPPLTDGRRAEPLSAITGRSQKAARGKNAASLTCFCLQVGRL